MLIRKNWKVIRIRGGIISAKCTCASTFFVLERMSLQLTILVLYSPPPSNFVPVSFFRRLLCFAPSDNYIQRSWTDERRTSFSPRSVGRSRSRSVPRWVSDRPANLTSLATNTVPLVQRSSTWGTLPPLDARPSCLGGPGTSDLIPTPEPMATPAQKATLPR